MAVVGVLLFLSGVAVVMSAPGRMLLGGLAAFGVCMALVSTSIAGWAMGATVAIAGLTAVALLWMQSLTQEAEQEAVQSSTVEHKDGDEVRARRRRRQQAGYGDLVLRASFAAVAAAIAIGLSSRAVPESMMSFNGLTAFAAYWGLAAGLMTAALSRALIGAAAGLTLVVEGAVVFYLSVASNLEAKVMIVATVLIVSIALGASFLSSLERRLDRPVSVVVAPAATGQPVVEESVEEAGQASETGESSAFAEPLSKAPEIDDSLGSSEEPLVTQETDETRAYVEAPSEASDTDDGLVLADALLEAPETDESSAIAEAPFEASESDVEEEEQPC